MRLGVVERDKARGQPARQELVDESASRRCWCIEPPRLCAPSRSAASWIRWSMICRTQDRNAANPCHSNWCRSRQTCNRAWPRMSAGSHRTRSERLMRNSITTNKASGSRASRSRSQSSGDDEWSGLLSIWSSAGSGAAGILAGVASQRVCGRKTAPRTPRSAPVFQDDPLWVRSVSQSAGVVRRVPDVAESLLVSRSAAVAVQQITEAVVNDRGADAVVRVRSISSLPIPWCGRSACGCGSISAGACSQPSVR